MPRKKMKGDEEPEMTIGMIVLVVGLCFVFFILFSSMTDFGTVVTTSQDTISTIGESHRAIACLGGADQVVTEAKLESAQATLDGCHLSNYDFCIRDLQTKKTWLDCDIVNPGHTIYFQLKAGDEVHIGRMDVKK
jgi:hypothetical protein